MAVSLVLVRAVLQAVEAAGVDRDQFLIRAGLDAERLERLDGRMDLAEYDAFLEHALDASGDPALALHMMREPAPSSFNVIAHVVEHASSMRNALELLTHFHRLISDRPFWLLEESDRTAVIRYAGEAGPPRSRRFRAEFTVRAMCHMVRGFAPGSWPELVAFDFAAPPYREAYAEAFRGRERFEQPFIGIVFDRKVLDVVQPYGDAELRSVVQAHATKKIAQLEGATTYADRVRDCVSANPGQRHMRDVARALGMSPRSLRRRLTEESAVYTEVVDRALASVATQLLVDERHSIQEVAYRLSFLDASTFCRAFKRWTGCTPKQYIATRTEEGAAAISRPRSSLGSLRPPSLVGTEEHGGAT